jgi:hypothetical protein
VLVLTWSEISVGVMSAKVLSPRKAVAALRVPVAFSLLMLTVLSISPDPLNDATLNVPNATT